MKTHSPDPVTPLRAVVLTIDGMTCGACVRHVQQALADLDGVESAEADLAQRQARVVYAPGLVAPEAMIAAIDDAGYGATLLPR